MTTFRVVGVREKWKKNTFLLFSGCVHLTAAEVQVYLKHVVLCGLVECSRCFVKGNDLLSSQSTVDP